MSGDSGLPPAASEPWVNDDIDAILAEMHTIAVVGLSNDPSRPSHEVASYLQSRGYRIIPVNPNEREVLGERAYPDLAAVPVPVDLVDVFRRAEFVGEVVDQAVASGAGAVWLQLGIRAPEAAHRARDQGLKVVMDRCLAVEHRRRHPAP